MAALPELRARLAVRRPGAGRQLVRTTARFEAGAGGVRGMLRDKAVCPAGAGHGSALEELPGQRLAWKASTIEVGLGRTKCRSSCTYWNGCLPTSAVGVGGILRRAHWRRLTSVTVARRRTVNASNDPGYFRAPAKS